MTRPMYENDYYRFNRKGIFPSNESFLTVIYQRYISALFDHKSFLMPSRYVARTMDGTRVPWFGNI